MMRSVGRLGLLCLALAFAVRLGLAADVDAKKQVRPKSHVTSRVTVQAVGPDGIAGRVSGREKACRAQRQVTVYRVNSGPSVSSGEFVASTWTHGDGSWQVPGPMFPSEFYAVIGAKKAERAACSAATSNSLAWG